MDTTHLLEATSPPLCERGVVAHNIASPVPERRPDLVPASNPAAAEPFAETLPQVLRDDLVLALLQAHPLPGMPDDLQSKLDIDEDGVFDPSAIGDLSEVDVFRLNRIVNLPADVLASLVEAEGVCVDLPYEDSVNLWGLTRDQHWHLLAFHTDPDIAIGISSRLPELGFIKSAIQHPYTVPPYTTSPHG